MPMNRDLFLAILAMDSYNRGYDAGLKGLASPGPNPAADVSIQIGKAKIIRDAADADGTAQAAGFYALAYDMTDVEGFADGERVIAFRGFSPPLQGRGRGWGLSANKAPGR